MSRSSKHPERGALVAIATLLLALCLAGCDPATAGRRCTAGFARDRTHVLACKNRRWTRLMTIGQYLELTTRQQPPVASEPSTASGPTPSTPATDPTGTLEMVQAAPFSISAKGWARDADAGAPIDVHMWVDSRWSSAANASGDRPDVAAAFNTSAAAGFDIAITGLPAGPHTACVHAINRADTPGSNVLLGCRSVTVLSDAPPDPLPASANWLNTMNYYRRTSGVDSVVEEPSWSAGIVSHLVYLRDTPASYRTGNYQSAHTENPASPAYTPDGDAAGGSSNLGGGSDQRSAIEGWMTAPFHAIGILRPNLESSAFGALGYSAGLDVIRGLRYPATPPTAPILFPGNGAVVRVTRFTGESPNPLESCPGYSSSGLPLIMMLPTDPPPSGINATMTLPYGAMVTAPDLCIVTRHTYQTSDPVYGSTGGSILATSNAVLIIPRSPLTPGRHTLHVEMPGQATIDWSFFVAQV